MPNIRDSKSFTSIIFLITFMKLNRVIKIRGLMWYLETMHIAEYLVVIIIVIIVIMIMIIMMIIIIVIMMIVIVIILPSLL